MNVCLPSIADVCQCRQMRRLSHQGGHLAIYTPHYHKNHRQSTQTTVFLAAESPEICMIPVDTAVDA